MTDEPIIETSPAPEVLTDQEHGATPLRHQPEQKAPETEAPAAPKTASDAIKAAMAKVEAESKADDGEKPEVQEKPEPPKNEEPEQKDVAAVKDGGDQAGEKETLKAAQSEGKADKIPSRLLPKEREVWANVPNAVKAAWERMEREHTEFQEKSKEHSAFHEELKPYAEMAKSANTTVKNALDRYVEFDKTLAQDFGRGMAQIVQAHGKNPVAAVAEMMRATGVAPQQLGAYLQGQPAQAQQAQPQQPRVDPVAQRALQEVEQLKQILAQQQIAAQQSRVEADIIAPFVKDHPRFEELGPDIEMFLKSGKVPSSLSPAERLEVAYDMAERINPSPVETPKPFSEPAITPQVQGKKSISGSPGKSTTSSGKPKIIPIRDAIAAAMRNA